MEHLDPQEQEAVSRLKRKLGEFDTEYLQQIYDEDRHDEWTDAAFEAIRQILQERLGSLPARRPAESPPEEEAPDTYFDKGKLISASLRLAALAKVFLGLAVLSLLGGVANAVMQIRSGADASLLLQYWSSWLVYPLTGFLTALAYYVVLRLVAELAFLLMDIEDNTRRLLSGERPSPKH